MPRRASALPALGSTQPPKKQVSAEQAARIAQKKAEALQRKLQKEHSQHIELPELAVDDDDALNLGFGFDL